MIEAQDIPESEAVSREAMERRRQYLLRWFQPDSGEETVNFADRDGNWTILTFLDDLARASSQAAGVEALKEACALYDDALDMMFDGPDEDDQGWARARWNEARCKVREALATPAASECQHEAWEQRHGSRTCADCGQHLDATTTAEARADGEVEAYDDAILNWQANKPLRREDARACKSPELCWEYNDWARCGPCALATQPAPVSGADGGVREVVQDFRWRAMQCRTNPDAFDTTAASVWECAAEALETKYADR